jgi:hypothetical protein
MILVSGVASICEHAARVAFARQFCKPAANCMNVNLFRSCLLFLINIARAGFVKAYNKYKTQKCPCA